MTIVRPSAWVEKYPVLASLEVESLKGAIVFVEKIRKKRQKLESDIAVLEDAVVIISDDICKLIQRQMNEPNNDYLGAEIVAREQEIREQRQQLTTLEKCLCRTPLPEWAKDSSRKTPVFSKWPQTNKKRKSSKRKAHKVASSLIRSIAASEAANENAASAAVGTEIIELSSSSSSDEEGLEEGGA